MVYKSSCDSCMRTSCKEGFLYLTSDLLQNMITYILDIIRHSANQIQARVAIILSHVNQMESHGQTLSHVQEEGLVTFIVAIATEDFHPGNEYEDYSLMLMS